MTVTKTAISIENSAKAFAERIEAGSKLNELLANEMVTRDESKRCPLKVKIGLEELYKDDLDDFPIIGEGPGGNNPDVFFENIPGKKKPREGSFWKAFARSIPFVAKAIKTQEAVANALSKNPDPAIAGNLVSLPDGVKEDRLKNARNHANGAVNIVLDAARIIRQEIALSEYPNIEISYNMEKAKDGNMHFREGKSVFVLKALDDKGIPTGASAYMSVGEFLALNVERAVEKGSTWESLLYSRKRESEPTNLAENVKTEGTFDEYVTSLWHFCQNPNAYDRMIKYLSNPEHASARRSFHEVYLFMDKVMTTKKIAKLTAEAEQEEDETEQAERNAKAA